MGDGDTAARRMTAGRGVAEPGLAGRAGIDATLAALADPTRRAVVGVLSRGPTRPSVIADELSTSRPVMSRHLRSLREAGIVAGEIQADDARVRVYRLLPGPFDTLRGWLDEVEAFWGDQLRSFRDHVAGKEAPPGRDEP